MVLTATLVGDRLEPVTCGHFGVLTTAEGQALLRDVEAAFGQGARPPPAAPAPAVDLASIVIVGVLGLVAFVLLGAVLLQIGGKGGPDAA